MHYSLQSPVGYYSDGLVRGLVTFGIVPVVAAFLTFGVLGIFGAALAQWFCYRYAMRIAVARISTPDAATGARPKHWLLGFGTAIAFQLGIVLFCVALADKEKVSERVNNIFTPESVRIQASSRIDELKKVRDGALADQRAGRYEEALEV